MYEDNVHELLMEGGRGARYSNATTQRALIVWSYLGQINDFHDVCKFYHSLEQLETTYTPEKAAASRNLDYSLMHAKYPPTSAYQLELFPNLYPPQDQIPPQEIISKPQPTLTNQKAPISGSTPREILSTVGIIREYCESSGVPLMQFVYEFRDHAIMNPMNPSLANIAFYIEQRKAMETLESKLAESKKDKDALSFTQRIGLSSNQPDNSDQYIGAASILFEIINSAEKQALNNQDNKSNEISPDTQSTPNVSEESKPSTSKIQMSTKKKMTERKKETMIVETEKAEPNITMETLGEELGNALNQISDLNNDSEINNNIANEEKQEETGVLEESRGSMNSTSDFLTKFKNLNVTAESEKENSPKKSKKSKKNSQYKNKKKQNLSLEVSINYSGTSNSKKDSINSNAVKTKNSSVLNSVNSDIFFDSESLNLSQVYPGSSIADTSNLSEDFEKLNKKRFSTSSQ